MVNVQWWVQTFRGTPASSVKARKNDSVWLRMPRPWPGMSRWANLAGVTICWRIHPTLYGHSRPRKLEASSNSTTINSKKIAQNVKKNDSWCFHNARVKTKKHSALERLSHLQSAFLRLSNARCFMIHSVVLDTLAFKGLSSATHAQPAHAVCRNFKSVRVPCCEQQKRAYLHTNELLRGRTIRGEPQIQTWKLNCNARANEFIHKLLRGWNKNAVTPGSQATPFSFCKLRIRLSPPLPSVTS